MERNEMTTALKEFTNEFVISNLTRFLKERHMFGEFMSEYIISERINKLDLRKETFTIIQAYNVIDYALDWAYTKRGFNFYYNLHTKWNKYFREKTLTLQ